MRLLVLVLPQFPMLSHDKPVFGQVVHLSPFSLMHWEPENPEFAACHTLPEAKPFTAFPAPYYQSACYKVPPGDHNNA